MLAELAKNLQEYDPRTDIERFATTKTEQWLIAGEQRALDAFQTAAARVPAYKDFLHRNNIDASKISSINDFKRIPPINKKNYIQFYDLKDRILDSDFSRVTIIPSSSGSSGQPYYWPKDAEQDFAGYRGLDLLFTCFFDADRIKTLFINCLALGVWQAGEFLGTAVKMMATKGYPISVINPGLNIDQAFACFSNLSPYYDQIIIGGYPSFLKDLAEEGVHRGIEWKRKNIKVFTGGEKYSENWRIYMTNTLGLSAPYRSIASIYAFVEVGAAGIATPYTEYLRQYLFANPLEKDKLFRGDLPTIVQYIPPLRYLEIVDGSIVATSNGLIPMVRYDTKDGGRILTPEEVKHWMLPSFADGISAIEKSYQEPQLPIVTVEGRVDRTITLYALNIYPEQIAGILDNPSMHTYITGRFVAETIENEMADQCLRLTLELVSGVEESASLASYLQDQITAGLKQVNSEYAHLVSQMGAKAYPHIELRSYHHPGIMPVSGKGITVRK